MRSLNGRVAVGPDVELEIEWPRVAGDSGPSAAVRLIWQSPDLPREGRFTVYGDFSGDMFRVVRAEHYSEDNKYSFPADDHHVIASLNPVQATGAELSRMMPLVEDGSILWWRIVERDSRRRLVVCTHQPDLFQDKWPESLVISSPWSGKKLGRVSAELGKRSGIVAIGKQIDRFGLVQAVGWGVNVSRLTLQLPDKYPGMVVVHEASREV